MSTTLSLIYQNTTRIFVVTVYVDDVVLDITGDACTFFIKSSKSDTDAQAELEKAAVVTDVATFTLTPTDTTIDPGVYVGEVRLTRANGEVYVLWIDTVSVKERVSDVV